MIFMAKNRGVFGTIEKLRPQKWHAKFLGDVVTKQPPADLGFFRAKHRAEAALLKHYSALGATKK